MTPTPQDREASLEYQGLIRDPRLTLADVQWVLGHAQITTPEIFMNPAPDEVISHVLAHHERGRRSQLPLSAPPAPEYRPEVLAALFGTSQITGGVRPRKIRDGPANGPRSGSWAGASGGVAGTSTAGWVVAGSAGTSGYDVAAAGHVYQHQGGQA